MAIKTHNGTKEAIFWPTIGAAAPIPAVLPAGVLKSWSVSGEKC